MDRVSVFDYIDAGLGVENCCCTPGLTLQASIAVILLCKAKRLAGYVQQREQYIKLTLHFFAQLVVDSDYIPSCLPGSPSRALQLRG